ncbi:MAG TPA: hypothetical protein VNH18_23335, partial [Bryobacteraceae bacterium]|nr:hypothetical protein [Bryobacteraceae bacterium]
YNIGAVFHLIARRYQGVPLPSRTFPLTSEADLDALVESVLSRVSTSSALFQMFGVLGEALTIQNGRVTWFSELPVEHVLQQPEFTEGKDLVIITLELGFDRFAKGTDSLTFIHPNDPGGDGFCTAFIHPVLRHFSGGKLASELHLQSGIFVRYDSPNEKFAIEFDKNKPRHLVFNFFTGFAGIATAERTVKSFTGEMIGGFTPWSADRREEDMGLPKCLATDGPKHLPDMAKYQ